MDSIIEDLRWLGVDWEDRLFFSSDYFDLKYEFALRLIKAGRAYVCDLSPEEIREYRGTLTEPGRESPYRNRSVEENLDLFERMRKGISRRFPGFAGQDRHGLRKPEYAGSGHLPDPACPSPPDGEEVVHLPDVRF